MIEPHKNKHNFPDSLFNPLDYESAYFKWRMLAPSAKKILIVGPGTGQDYFYLQKDGRHIDLVDIAPQDNLPDVILQDLQKGLLFEDKLFDAVILGEILEHLFDDVAALLHVRRVLKDDGQIILSVPFLNDDPEWHVRVHTPKSIRRLLQHCGFRVECYVERGEIAHFSHITMKRRWRKLLCQLLRQPFDPLQFAYSIAVQDYEKGMKENAKRKSSPYYGCTISARKDEPRHFEQLQIDTFTNMINKPI